MRKLTGSINSSLDGYCDHTHFSPDADVHRHYAELIDNSSHLLYGRKTYELMKYWQTLLSEPSGEEAMDAFAVSIDRVPKTVFSSTLKETGWESAELANKSLKDTVTEMKQAEGMPILAGSPGLIVELLNLQLLDELQLCIHPGLRGSGKLLFADIKGSIDLKLLNTKTFDCGAIVLYYRPIYPK